MAVCFDKLNFLEYNKSIKTGKLLITDKEKINNIKKLYAERLKFSLNIYSIYFCDNQKEIYYTIISSIVKSYSVMLDKPHILCSSIEHNYINDILMDFVKNNLISISIIPANIYGGVNVNQVEELINGNTCLIIVAYSNYLTGTINNIKDISKIAHKYKIPLFSDTIYTIGKIPINAANNNIDIFTGDFTKKNLGLLIIKKDLFIGFKLKDYSNKFNLPKVEISDSDYNYVYTGLNRINKIDQDKTKNKMLILRKYFISILTKNNKNGKIYYYDDIVNQDIKPDTNDIIILGYDVNIPDNDNKMQLDTISFILMKYNSINISKIKNIYMQTNINLYENIGIITKYAKRIITVNLQNITKSDINIIIKQL